MIQGIVTTWKCVCMCICVCVWKGGQGHRAQRGTEHRDQYIISYKLNSTSIDPEGVCDRLGTVDECTVNPTDQYGGQDEGVEGGWGVLSQGCLNRGRRREELGLGRWWRAVNMEQNGWWREMRRLRYNQFITSSSGGSLSSPCHYLQEASPPICLHNGRFVWTQSIL